MKHFALLALVFALAISAGCVNGVGKHEEEEEAGVLVKAINAMQIDAANKLSQASWNYATNLTSDNASKEKAERVKFADFLKSVKTALSRFDWQKFDNVTLKRMIKMMTSIGDSVLDANDFHDLMAAKGAMAKAYSTAKVPSLRDGNLMSLEPEISEVFDKSRDPGELAHYWTKWYDTAGTRNRENFFRYVALKNKAARTNSESHSSLATFTSSSCQQITEAQPKAGSTPTKIRRSRHKSRKS